MNLCAGSHFFPSHCRFKENATLLWRLAMCWFFFSLSPSFILDILLRWQIAHGISSSPFNAFARHEKIPTWALMGSRQRCSSSSLQRGAALTHLSVSLRSRETQREQHRPPSLLISKHNEAQCNLWKQEKESRETIGGDKNRNFFKKKQKNVCISFKRCSNRSHFVLWEAIMGCFFFFWSRQKEVMEAITKYEGWGWWWWAAAVIHSNLHSAWWDWRTTVWNCCKSEIKEMSDFWSKRHWRSNFKQAESLKSCEIWSLPLSCLILSCYKLLSGLFGQKTNKKRWKGGRWQDRDNCGQDKR